MFKKMFNKPKKTTTSSTLSTLEKLNEVDRNAMDIRCLSESIQRNLTQLFDPCGPVVAATLEMLEKKEHVLQKKISIEIGKAQNFTKLKNKKAAIQCLKKKKLYEAQVEQLGNFQLRVHDQMILLEGAKATTETVDALRSGASAMKSIQKSMNIDAIEMTMDEVNEHTENMRQIQEALTGPIGATADFDEDELEAELEQLEEAELEEQLMQPTHAVPASSVPTANIPNRANLRSKSDEDELANLQAEMAI